MMFPCWASQWHKAGQETKLELWGVRGGRGGEGQREEEGKGTRTSPSESLVPSPAYKALKYRFKSHRISRSIRSTIAAQSSSVPLFASILPSSPSLYDGLRTTPAPFFTVFSPSLSFASLLLLSTALFSRFSCQTTSARRNQFQQRRSKGAHGSKGKGSSVFESDGKDGTWEGD
eukprot:CAMPEP_0175058310 /NCGR_PEP_ID=MMETSP0052_2-20121109/11777_1 /TAXON_ID=51329 ORGANISM="Polytomella parva, Strain SAG 63-3" /NCGR_SAMPLE_ID=MMETSP0052_2 /ASSEMBLY_ACC=CAM_ASM_000194 /LENGTH=173 /DNA_ID=CAMNT_0016323677 /DNA_START=149 /DNA_END=670 /DNA_ORIENTATION=+